MSTEFSLADLIPDAPLINVVDIGAASLGPGTEPYAALMRAKKVRVVGFEPNREACDKLNRQHGAPHAFHPFFVGDGEAATFFETNWPLTSSLFEPNMPLLDKFQNLGEITTVTHTQPVETRRLDDVPGIGDVDFFKVDAQGAELKIFTGAGNALTAATMVQTEVIFVEMYKKQPLFADIDAFLRRAGFQFHTFLGFGSRCFKPMKVNDDPNMGLRQFLWSDAVYVRDFMRLAEVPVDKLLKLAIMLHDIVKSYDLCHYVLSEADARGGTALAQVYFRKLAEQGSGG